MPRSLFDPHFFLGQPLVKELLLPGLGVQDLIAALEERRIVAGPVVELAAVELDDSRGQLFQKHPVVGDEDQGAAGTRQKSLEPADGVDIEVIGRLVQKQDIGLADQRLGEQHAPLHPGGKVFEARSPGPDPCEKSRSDTR